MAEPVTVTAVALVGATNNAANLLDKLGLLEGIKRRLVNEPDVTSQKLAVALAEVSVSYELLYRALLRLANLSFTAKERADADRFIYELSTGQLRGAIAKARGHCGVIDNIRRRHLNGVFNRIFRQKQAKEVRELFEILSDFDNQLMTSLDALNNEGRKHAMHIRALLKNGQVSKATAYVGRINDELLGPLGRLADGMAILWRIQADIKVGAGATQ